MRYFLYTPCSGSKLLAAGWGVTVHTRPWGEGHTAEKAPASHDVEAHDIVAVYAAAPRDHWRDAGRKWLTLLVGEVGGAAADDCGELIYYAPTAEAAYAARVLLSQLGHDHEQRSRLLLEAAREIGQFCESASWVEAERALVIARQVRQESQRRAMAERLGVTDAEIPA